MAALPWHSRDDVTEMLARCRQWCPALYQRLFLRNRDGAKVDVYNKLAERYAHGRFSGSEYYCNGFIARSNRFAGYASQSE